MRWINGERRRCSREPRILDEYRYAYGVERLYTNEEITEQFGVNYEGYRVDLHYFVGHRVFRAIYDEGGRDAYQYAITHPEELLSLYLDICNEDPSLPQISEELADAWSQL